MTAHTATTLPPQPWLHVLSNEYIPQEIMFRDRQLTELRSSQEDPFLHFYCEGQKSTGKTITVRKYLEEVTSMPNHAGIYLFSERAIQQDFKRAMERALGRPLGWRETPFHLLGEMQAEHIHVIIDDVQKIVLYRMFNNFIHSLFEYTQEYKKKLHLTVVGQLTYPKFMRHIRSDVESRYRFKPILFEFYEVSEVEAILEQRLRLLGIDFDVEALKFVSAKIRRLASDLRLGFEILKRGCDISNGKRITNPIISKAWEKTKVDYWKQQLRSIDDERRILLFCATVSAQQSADVGNIDENGCPIITTHGITELYQLYCRANGVEPVYKQRVTFLFRKLVDLDWLEPIGRKSEGRYGQTRIFRYEQNPSTVLPAFKEFHLEMPPNNVASATDWKDFTEHRVTELAKPTGRGMN